MKTCTKCGVEKAKDDFYKDVRRRDGLFSACKVCHNRCTAAWTERNKERKKSSDQLWREMNAEKRRIAFRRRYQRTDAVVPKTKVCSTCHQEKQSVDFHPKKDASDGLYPRCKKCRAVGDREWRGRNADWLRSYERNRYEANPKRREISRQWYAKNKNRALVRSTNYAKSNPERLRIIKRRYVALHGHYSRFLKRACVAWADHEAILRFYEERDRLTLETGLKYHVDHIVPIRSRLVCGLHNQFNLRVILASENLAKKNKHWPDMPDAHN